MPPSPPARLDGEDDAIGLARCGRTLKVSRIPPAMASRPNMLTNGPLPRERLATPQMTQGPIG
ncbi:hypothetical protein SFOMI_3949 [Sphingobium fuliginis]|uniref:Uncharacterized protein n=1 Tax=Sphingobium fuliginis (strain ATCC 27551) TaxID=336203 RepID=A0A292ZKH2_SPHSA|nr:hypothetical protein SFOMI_3949 [Sphingobium fuliginis]